MTPSKILVGTREKIPVPATWLRSDDPDVGSRDADGRSVGHEDPTAVCSCLFHALLAASPGVDGAGRDAALLYLATAIEGAWVQPSNAGILVIEWNDVPERTHAEVLTALNVAISAAELDEKRWSIFDEEYTYDEIRSLLDARDLWSEGTDEDLRAMTPGACIYFEKLSIQRFR